MIFFIIPLGFLFLPSNILIGKTGGASIVFIFSFFYFALDCSNTGLFHLFYYFGQSVKWMGYSRGIIMDWKGFVFFILLFEFMGGCSSD